MNITISTDNLIAELRYRLRDICVCQARVRLKEIDKIYLPLKEQAEKEIPFSCIE